MGKTFSSSREPYQTLSSLGINFVLKARNYPGQSLTTDQTTSFTGTTTKIDTRARGRQAAVRFESDDDAANNGNLGIGWRLGATRIDIRTDGRR